MNSLIEEGRVDKRFNPPHSSIHIGVINGGIAPNVIADKVRFSWDLRTIPKDDIFSIISDFEEYCRERENQLRKVFPNFKIKNIEYHPIVPHLDTSENDDILKLIKKISGNSDWSTVSFGAEAGHYANNGFHTAICGPGDIAQAHRADEFISKDQLNNGVGMIQNLIKEFS
tara:strand:- start:144 stop:656 length:513 start_codon:yes stop_codon:yes gene_type:complete